MFKRFMMTIILGLALFAATIPLLQANDDGLHFDDLVCTAAETAACSSQLVNEISIEEMKEELTFLLVELDLIRTIIQSAPKAKATENSSKSKCKEIVLSAPPKVATPKDSQPKSRP